jgi:CDP-paratose 2-epimerase
VRCKYVDQNRQGDHICYISDLSRLKAHYPDWSITRSLPAIVDEMVAAELAPGVASR